MKLIIVGTHRYSINMCDFDLIFRYSDHEIVNVLWHKYTKGRKWFRTGKHHVSNRDKIATKLTELPNEAWFNPKGLLKKIDKLNFDYLCIGNGNDKIGKMLQSKLKTKFLFSEYGWLPWNKCFFIDHKGTGALSSLHALNINKTSVKDKPEEIEDIKNNFNKGKPIDKNLDKFVYVPLQVDTIMSDGKQDFKFRFTRFKNNNDFLQHVRNVVPNNIPIVIKNHPKAHRKTKPLGGMIDITGKNWNKYELYNKMAAMICINSTSAIEGLLFGKKLFAY